MVCMVSERLSERPAAQPEVVGLLEHQQRDLEHC